MLALERALFKAPQFQRHPRAHFLQDHLPAFVFKQVPVVTEEEEVTLVLHSHHAAPSELRPLWEYRHEHPGKALPQPSVKALKDELRVVARRVTMVRDLLPSPGAGDPEVGSRPVRQVDDTKSVRLLVPFTEYQQVSVLPFLRELNDLSHFESLPVVVLQVGDDSDKLIAKADELGRRLLFSCYQDLRRDFA